jgi:hypothetical protein
VVPREAACDCAYLGHTRYYSTRNRIDTRIIERQKITADSTGGYGERKRPDISPPNDPAAQPLKTFRVMPLPPLIERMDAGYVSREAQGRTQSASLGRAMT